LVLVRPLAGLTPTARCGSKLAAGHHDDEIDSSRIGNHSPHIDIARHNAPQANICIRDITLCAVILIKGNDLTIIPADQIQLPQRRFLIPKPIDVLHQPIDRFSH
jgi:hypothetical protein